MDGKGDIIRAGDILRVSYFPEVRIEADRLRQVWADEGATVSEARDGAEARGEAAVRDKPGVIGDRTGFKSLDRSGRRTKWRQGWKG